MARDLYAGRHRTDRRTIPERIVEAHLAIQARLQELAGSSDHVVEREQIEKHLKPLGSSEP